MAKVRLGLEWLTLPVFMVAMQLPQAVLVYWSASSGVALLQVSFTFSICNPPPPPLQSDEY